MSFIEFYFLNNLAWFKEFKDLFQADYGETFKFSLLQWHDPAHA